MCQDLQQSESFWKAPWGVWVVLLVLFVKYCVYSLQLFSLVDYIVHRENINLAWMCSFRVLHKSVIFCVFVLVSGWYRFLVLPYDTEVWNAGASLFLSLPSSLSHLNSAHSLLVNILNAIKKFAVAIHFTLNTWCCCFAVAGWVANDLQLLCLCILFVSGSLSMTEMYAVITVCIIYVYASASVY